MSGQYGIKETKEASEFLLALQGALIAALKDGKIGFFELPNFFSSFFKLGPALENMALIPRELSDLQVNEIEELKVLFKQNFDLEDDALEAKIKEGFDLLLAIGKFVGDVKK